MYLHLDVPKPDESKWSTDPWTLTTENKKIYGCGAGCGKGPMMAWFHVIEAFRKSDLEFPVNLRFVIESMHHDHSLGLANFIESRMQDLFCGIDCIVTCDSEWLGEKHPCIIYGSAGESISSTAFDIKSVYRVAQFHSTGLWRFKENLTLMQKVKPNSVNKRLEKGSFE